MTTATIDRSEVMTKAWAALKSYAPARDIAELRRRLSRELRQAWFSVKRAAQLASMTDAQKAQDALNVLRSKNHWTEADYNEADRLARIAADEVAAGRAADFAEKRDLIASAKGRFCSVVFIKKDGTERAMQVQPAALAQHVKGNAATMAGKRAVITRKASNPHLLAVWDVQAKAPRSINLATVKSITLDGMAHAYQVAA